MDGIAGNLLPRDPLILPTIHPRLSYKYKVQHENTKYKMEIEKNKFNKNKNPHLSVEQEETQKKIPIKIFVRYKTLSSEKN